MQQFSLTPFEPLKSVIFEEFQGDRLQCPGRGGYLVEYVDAVGVAIDHPLNAADLTRGAPQPLWKLGFSFSVTRDVATFRTPRRPLYPGAVRIAIPQGGIVRDPWPTALAGRKVREVSGVAALIGLGSMALVALVGIFGLWGAHRWLNVGRAIDPAGLPYLSGFPPAAHALSRYHVRWYPLTLLFLAFDVEMLFMYPWAVVVAEVGASAVIEMFVFLALLMAGVVWAYREGALRWV